MNTLQEEIFCMKIMKFGSRGPNVQFLQLALNRAGFGPVVTDGIFGARTRQAVREFQSAHGLTADGIAGPNIDRALMPWYTGFVTHTLKKGDSLYALARQYHSSIRALEAANPALDPFNLQIGSKLTVPLAFPVVPTGIDWTSDVLERTIVGLAARYPFLRVDIIGRSVMGTAIPYIRIGTGPRRVLYNASHHANEWITTPVLMRFVEDLSRAAVQETTIGQTPAAELLSAATLYIVPAVNPDGIDLVTGFLDSGSFYDRAVEISKTYPVIPFPAGWKANIAGTDLNLQYPAGWEQAKQIKFAQGYISPAPRDFVGDAPLSAPESRALYDFTLSVDPDLILAYHTQGQVIYWKFLDFEPAGSRLLAYRFAAVSGYAVEDTPYASGYAGYKDWFIQNYNRPGYTIEAGLGENPLPISQFEEIYGHNLGILIQAALG